MIRYSITQTELEVALKAESPTWLRRAGQRTAQHRKGKRFSGKGIWSDIKRVYMKLQHFKCAYCERPLEPEERANIEHDVEHFRPKGRVINWPSAEPRRRRKIRYKAGKGRARGYPLLAHSHLNYLVSCKVCNSAYKDEHFPIAGKAGSFTADIAELNRKEKPLLLQPIGDWGEDPEQVLTFNGCVPVPAKKSGPSNLRARVCIDLFELDTRGRLIEDRARALAMLWPWLEQRRTGSSQKRKQAQALVEALTADRAPHANCSRAFVALHQRDRAKAFKHYEVALAHLEAKERALYKHLLP